MPLEIVREGEVDGESQKNLPESDNLYCFRGSRTMNEEHKQLLFFY